MGPSRKHEGLRRCFGVEMLVTIIQVTDMGSRQETSPSHRHWRFEARQWTFGHHTARKELTRALIMADSSDYELPTRAWVLQNIDDVIVNVVGCEESHIAGRGRDSGGISWKKQLMTGEKSARTQLRQRPLKRVFGTRRA